MDLEIAKTVLAALEREGVRYVVFGAVAINLPGLARATEDLDLFIAPDSGNIERLKAALRSVFVDPSIEEILAEDLLGDYPAVQY
ncbi:MAG TPA: nucleotidyl transferase AbiEii/AbiGii toxin family protein, partial [Opitutaceae bacterium]|nr:nucleotidyl transferase AbiEii/AbiGii toxin family protein [Opitutaceae bacterium]